MGKKVVLSLLFFLFFSCDSSVHALKTLFSPITQDPNLPLFTLSLNTNEKYFIHIGAPFLVRRCDDGLPHPIVPCSSTPCLQSRVFSPHMCPLPNNTVINGRCACQGTAFDPLARQCASNQFTYGNFAVPSTDPTNPNVTINFVYYLCVPVPFLGGLPPGVFGVAGLSSSTLSPWNQFTRSNLGLDKKFALCLPKSDNIENKGVIFFGAGPYKLGSPTMNFDASTILSYTPLIRNLQRLNNYYIGLRGISINGKSIQFGPNKFGFDYKGNGGVTLSTIVPFTTLRSDIYEAFVNEFSTATVNIPRAANVGAFGFCLQTNATETSEAGFDVPPIDLNLINGKNWTVVGVNSIKRVSPEVACLAFLDGGAAAEQAVVIGTYQMENNLLVFDNARSMLGFSSTLDLVNVSCSDFQTRP